MARTLVAISLILASTGCASLPSPQETAPNLATAVTFRGTQQQAFEIARDSLLAVGITPAEGSAAKGFIAGNHGVSAWSWGERVGVYFRERDDGLIVMWVISKRKLATNVTAPDWTAPVLAQIRSRLSGVAGGLPRSPGQRSTGTCFAIDSQGTIVTAYHVIGDATRLTVRLATGALADAQVVASAQAVDLAVLKIGLPTPGFLDIAPPRSLQVGEDVFTLGFPVVDILGSEPKFTDGTISSLSGLGDEASLIQISVPVQPGNSGAPLVTGQGQVVGVVTSTASAAPFFRNTGALPQNVNWAVKIDFLRPLVNETQPTQPPTLNRADAIARARRAVCLVESTT